MKQLKQMCQQHKSVVISFADGQPICSFCDTSQFWVLESCQSLVDEQYINEQSNKVKFRNLLNSLQGEFKELIKSFSVFEQGIINRIHNFVDMYLDQDYKFDEICELKDRIHYIMNNLFVTPKFKKQEYYREKIVSITLPKTYKLSTLNAIEQQIVYTKYTKEEQNNQQNYEHHHKQQNQLTGQQIGIVVAPQVDEKKRNNRQARQDRQDRLKKLQTDFKQFSEDQFYQRVRDDLNGLKIFDLFLQKKLSIDLAPQYLLNLNRCKNFYDITAQDQVIIVGYSENCKLTGRGVVYCTQYIENGYYIAGLLVWGQLFYANHLDNILYEEIDNTENIDTIKQYGNYSSKELWDKSHLARIVEQMKKKV